MKKLFLVLFVNFFVGSVFASLSETEEDGTEEISSESANAMIEKIEQLNLMPEIKKEKSHEDFWKEKRKGFKNQKAFLIEDPKRYPVDNKKIIFEIPNKQAEEELNEMLNNLHFDKENNPNSQNIIWESKGNFEDFFNDSEEEDDLQPNSNEIKKEEKSVFQECFSASSQSNIFSTGLKKNGKRNAKKKKKTPKIKKTNSLQDINLLQFDENNLTDSYYVINDSGKRKRSQPEI